MGQWLDPLWKRRFSTHPLHYLNRAIWSRLITFGEPLTSKDNILILAVISSSKCFHCRENVSGFLCSDLWFCHNGRWSLVYLWYYKVAVFELFLYWLIKANAVLWTWIGCQYFFSCGSRPNWIFFSLSLFVIWNVFCKCLPTPQLPLLSPLSLLQV